MTETEHITARFFVSGRVQGVFYRASSADKARSLALRGYARNLPDGRVEVLASGSSSAIAELQRWLHDGPPMARVERVERQPADPADVPEDFEVRR